MFSFLRKYHLQLERNQLYDQIVVTTKDEFEMEFEYVQMDVSYNVYVEQL